MPDFRALQSKMPQDKDYPERTFDIQCLTRVLDGTLYDHLKHPFSEEKAESSEYVKLNARRPSARTRICRTVVNDSVAMLFDDDHFPSIECKDEETREEITALIKELGLRRVMIESATRGSVGSVAIQMRVLKRRVFFEVHKTAFLTPKWKADEPDVLESVTERYKVKGHALKERGYTIDDKDLNTDFWFQRIWTESDEEWYQPQSVTDAKDETKKPQIDTDKSVNHTLGFVPMVWIKNLPGGNGIDGEPTFPLEAIDMQIECDYLLSQGGRGLKYQSDPTLVIKEPPALEGGGGRVKGAANALVVGTEGDAKLLEITGDGAKSVLDWVRGLRELALEGAGGNRSNADKISAAQSGRAMELMHQSLINLASKLRISYGDNGLQPILDMIVAAAGKMELITKRGEAVNLETKEPIALRWSRWFAPTYADMQTEAGTLTALRQGNLLSQQTAVQSLAHTYDITDVEAEQKLIDADKAADLADQVKLKSPALSQSDD